MFNDVVGGKNDSTHQIQIIGYLNNRGEETAENIP